MAKVLFVDFKVNNVSFNSNLKLTKDSIKFSFDYTIQHDGIYIYLEIPFNLYNKSFSMSLTCVSIFKYSDADIDDAVNSIEFINSLIRISFPYLRSAVSSIMLACGYTDIKLPLFNSDRLSQLPTT